MNFNWHSVRQTPSKTLQNHCSCSIQTYIHNEIHISEGFSQALRGQKQVICNDGIETTSWQSIKYLATIYRWPVLAINLQQRRRSLRHYIQSRNAKDKGNVRSPNSVRYPMAPFHCRMQLNSTQPTCRIHMVNYVP